MPQLSQAERKRLKALVTRKGRLHEKAFRAEGVRLLEEALNLSYLPAEVIFSPTLMSRRGLSLVKKFRGAGIDCREVGQRDLEDISEVESSQGLCAWFRITAHDPGRIISRSSRILLLDAVADPGNVGSLIRSALAFGFETVILGPGAVDPYNPKVVRSSAGAIFGIPLLTAEFEDILAYKKDQKLKLVAADKGGRSPGIVLKRIKRYDRFILAVGSEAVGLSKPIRDTADIIVKITHGRRVESLNAAVAGSILMKEFYDRYRVKS